MAEQYPPYFTISFKANGLDETIQVHGFKELEKVIENLYFQRDYHGANLYDLHIEVIAF